jgi:hypothetical protein
MNEYEFSHRAWLQMSLMLKHLNPQMPKRYRIKSKDFWEALDREIKEKRQTIKNETRKSKYWKTKKKAKK